MAKIPRDLLSPTLPANANPKLIEVATQIEHALNKAGYSETSYYSVPSGFVIVSRLEQCDDDGTPKPPPERFDRDARVDVKFSLIRYLKALFTAQPGRFRLIVFAVTDEPFVSDKRKIPDREEAIQWVAAGTTKLPEQIGKRHFSANHDVIALIYEFYRPTTDHAFKLTVPSALQGRTHLEKAGLWPPWRK
jgi:hypothetical protein